MKSQITDFALGGWCGGLPPSGFRFEGAAAAEESSKCRSASPPRPLPARVRNLRRDDMGLEPVNEFIGVNQGRAKIDEHRGVDRIQAGWAGYGKRQFFALGLPIR